MSRAAPFSAAVAGQAVAWLVEFADCPPTPQRLAQWRSWLDADPVHHQAWQRIETVRARWRQLPPGAARDTLERPASPARRRALQALGVLAVGGTSALLVARAQPWQADYRTGVGETRSVALADGVRLTLNTDSAIALGRDPRRHQVTLLRGEVLASVSARAGRPLRLACGQGWAEAVEAQFVLRAGGDSDTLGVHTGAVRLCPSAARPLSLPAGRQVHFRAAGIVSNVVLAAEDASWADGMLVVSGWRLADLLAELGRYRHGWIHCDPAIAGLRVSGTYPLADTDRILQLLASGLGLELRQRTRLWVGLYPRPPAPVAI